MSTRIARLTGGLLDKEAIVLSGFAKSRLERIVNPTSEVLLMSRAKPVASYVMHGSLSPRLTQNAGLGPALIRHACGRIISCQPSGT